MEGNDPTAQGQDPADPGGDQSGSQAEAKGPQNGIQKRIDELTAKIYERDAKLAEREQAILELTGKVAEMATRSNQPPPQQELVLPEGADPALVGHFGKMLERFEQRLEQRLSGIGASIAGTEAQRASEKYAAMVGDKTGWISQRASALAAGWRQNGLPFKAEDAARFAMAEFIEKRGAAQPGNGNFVPPVMPNGAPNPPTNFAPPQPRALPPNFDSLSPNQQEKILQERGVDDLPL